MFLIVTQFIHVRESGSFGCQPETVATATTLPVARRIAAATAAAGDNVIGIYNAEKPEGPLTKARRLVRVLGGIRENAPEEVVWWGDEPHHA